MFSYEQNNLNPKDGNNITQSFKSLSWVNRNGQEFACKARGLYAAINDINALPC